MDYVLLRCKKFFKFKNIDDIYNSDLDINKKMKEIQVYIATKGDAEFDAGRSAVTAFPIWSPGRFSVHHKEYYERAKTYCNKI